MALIETFCDNFNDNTMDSNLWSVLVGPGSTVETGGQLAITPATTAGAQYDGYTTINTYDLTGSGVTVQYVKGLNATLGCETTFNLQMDGNNYVSFLSTNTGYVFRHRTAGVNSETYLTPRNDPAVLWWRLMERSGTIYWDTSNDGVHWINRRARSTTFAITSLTIRLTAGTYQNVATPGTAIFDNVNILNTSTSGWLAV